MKPTKEQIEQALSIVACEVEAHRHDMSPHTANAFATILSAIPALIAELEAEQAAHAEARQSVVSRAQAVQEQAEAFLQAEAAWQSATGHASPEAYRASRVEPAADVIERLGAVYRVAMRSVGPHKFNRESYESHLKRAEETGIRAVVAALAEMGADSMPSANEIGDAYDKAHSREWDRVDEAGRHPHEVANGEAQESICVRAAGDAVRSLVLSRLAPVLGARRVLDHSEEVEPVMRLLRDQLMIDERYAYKVARHVIDLIRSRHAPPTDEQLAEEAERYAFAKDGVVEAGTTTMIHVEEAYAAGARREGQR